MTAAQPGAGVVGVAMQKVTGSTSASLTDTLSVEEPLEIRLTADVAGRRTSGVVAVTMRTPGNDRELAAGFLFTEGIVSETDDIEDVCNERRNLVENAHADCTSSECWACPDPNPYHSLCRAA